MSMLFRQYLLFRDGWDERDELDVESRLVEASRHSGFRKEFMPAFVELIRREQFLKTIECLDRDKDIEFNRGFVTGLEMILNLMDRLKIKGEQVIK